MASRSVASDVGADVPRLVIATHSEHKLRELRELLHLDHAELVSLDDLGVTGEPIEDGETFETNAAIKARFAVRGDGPPGPRRRLRPRGGRPGRRPRASGRGATPARTPPTPTTTPSCSPRSMACRPSDAGRATCACSRWRSPATRARAEGSTWRSRGGRVAVGSRARRAGAGGFGYDPIFEPASEPPGGRTLGLWTPAEKNAISHRARAARRMAARLADARVLSPRRRRRPPTARSSAPASARASAPSRAPGTAARRPRGSRRGRDWSEDP